MCSNGAKQSPINILTGDVLPHPDGICPFVFHGYNANPLKFNIKNEGNTIYFSVVMNQNTAMPYITGGGLPEKEKFEFHSGHFHWNSEGQSGSCHHVDNMDAPLELHLVHWNKKKGNNLTSAISTNEWNALAVLGIIYDIGKHNKGLDPLFDALDEVHGNGKSVSLSNGYTLKTFLPRGTGRFFRYNGSLTTPPCNEVVIWTVFKDREFISKEQLNKLRDTIKGVNNNRPVQPLNERNVLDIDTRDYDGHCSDFSSAAVCPSSPSPGCDCPSAIEPRPYPDCSSHANNFHMQNKFASSLLAVVTNINLQFSKLLLKWTLIL